MKPRILSAALLALLTLGAAAPAPAPAQADELRGRVVDAATGRPVGGATVSAEPAGVRALTDAAGEFRLRGLPAGRQTVTVRALGYARLAAPVEAGAGAAPLELRLAAAVIPLEEVVVTGTVAATELRAVPNQVGVVTAERIRERGAVRMEEVLRAELPGLFSAEAPASAAQGVSRVRLFARGSTNFTGRPSPPKVYVDGVILSDPSELNAIDPASIERIEFIPGPQASTIYGSGAINGVMQVFLKKGEMGAERTRVTLELSGGTIQNSFDRRLAPEQAHRLEVAGGRGPVSYTLGGGYRGEGDWLPGRTEERFGMDAGLRLVLDRATAQATARFGWMHFDGYSDPSRREATLAGRQALTPRVLGRSDLATRWAHRTLGVTLGYASTPWWRHELTAGHDTRASASTRPPQLLSFADTLFNLQDIDQGTSTLRLTSTAELPLRGPVRPTLVAGVEHAHDATVITTGSGRFADGSLSASGYHRARSASTGVFAQTQVGVMETLYLTGGVRVEEHRHFGEDYGLSVQPRAGATLVQTAGRLTGRVRGAYGRAINPPPAGARRDVYRVDFFGRRYLSSVANPELGPEVQRGGEAGIDLAWDGRFSLGVTRYDQTADDLIHTLIRDMVDTTLINDFGAPLYFSQLETVNLGRVRNTGWEVEGAAEAGQLRVRGTFGTMRSRVLELNDPENDRYILAAEMVGPPRESGSLDLRWRAGRLEAGGRVVHVGRLRLDRNDALAEEALSPRTLPESPRVFNPFASYMAGSYTVSGYQTVDLRAAYTVTPTAQLFASVFNAGDRYRNDVTNTAVARGRRTLAGVRMHF
jgi:outer membrane receptor protein involved in Fe transport